MDDTELNADTFDTLAELAAIIRRGRNRDHLFLPPSGFVRTDPERTAIHWMLSAARMSIQ